MNEIISLDEIFPKEVMERAEWWSFRDEDGDVQELMDTPHSTVEFYIFSYYPIGDISLIDPDNPCEMTLVAMSDENIETDYGTMKKVIAERRIRLSLNVELLGADER